MSAKVCAWASWAEWRTVYDQLASSNASEREKGVRRVETWRSRGRLPVAVDVTGSFVEIMLNDPVLNKSTKAPRSEHELRLMYSMALIRLVNGIVDVAQRKAVAGSISTLAQELDWPQWFVEMRHEATHQKLPSLSLLRIAAKEALWLLLERFWRPQLTQLEQRGRTHSQAVQTRHRSNFGPNAALRDHQLLDKKLRGLLQAASASGKSQGDIAGDCKASDKAVRVARELAALAADESRLLMRLLALLKDCEPDAEGQQADAICALCVHVSENFTLRFIRDLTMKALGTCGTRHEPAADNAPGLRNICDTCNGNAAAPGSSDADERNSVLTTGFDDETEATASRMLRWLQAFMARRDKAAQTSSPTAADHCTARFAQAAAELTPGLRCIALRATPAISQHTAAMERLARVLQLLRPGGLVQDDGPCNAFSGQPTTAADKIVAAATAHRGQQRKKPAEGQSENGRPSLENIEQLLHARKRKRQTVSSDTSGGGPQTSKEPWTAVGTVLEADTLKVFCHSEIAANGVASVAGCLEALTPVVSDSAASASPQQVPCPAMPEEPLATIAALGATSSEARGDPPLASGEEAACLAAPQAPPGISEEDHRNQVAKLFQNLRPFGS